MMPDPLAFTLDDLAELNPDPAPAHRTRGHQPNACKTATSVKIKQQARQESGPDMLRAALWYARRGWYVFPVHVPLFDDDGHCNGCTCEAWKRTQAKYGPDYKCPQPGKCPAVRWAEKATIDPEQIRKWWGHQWKTTDATTGKTIYYTPNIGIACGPSSLLVLDADAYKDGYAGDNLLSFSDEQTVTSLTGNLGAHLIYDRQGKPYGNATGDLPDGIDIRGVGGYIVAPPSLHKSGRRYQFEEGYNPAQIELKPIPTSLISILDEAHTKSLSAQAATFTTVTTEKPDLIRWHIGKDIRELIHNPPPKSKRSEADFSVCLSLVYAGASDDEIRAVFQHYPIGEQGKYAEGGDQYLALTLGKARAWADAHPRPDVRATLTNLMLWTRTHSFEPFINPQLISSDGIYRTDQNDTKVAIAILMLMCTLGRLTINVGKKRLAKLAGIGSCNTVLAALERLSWLFSVTSDPLQGMQITLDLSRLQQIDPHIKDCIVFNRDQFSANDAPKPIVDEYSPRIADEPFLVGTAKHLRERFEIIAQTFDITLAEAKEYPIYNEATGKEELTFPGLGESGLRVIDALQRVGDMTAQELADETGKKISSIRTALRKLVQHGIVEATRESAITPYTYSLAPDALRLVDAIAPTLRTHKMTSYREDKRIEEAQQYAVNGYAQAKEQGDQVKESRIEERFMKLAKARMTHLRRINVNMTTEQIEDKYRVYGMLHAYKYQTVNPSDPELFKPNVRTQETKAAFRNQRRDLQKTWEAEHSDNIRMIRELAYVTIDEFKAQGLRKPTRRMVVREIMKYGTFDETTVSAVIASSKQMADYRPLGGAA